jgi:hypothetical protein
MLHGQEPARRSPQPRAGRLRHWPLPAFSDRVQELARLDAADPGGARALVPLILRDLPLTARVLRAANSYYHNPQRRPIPSIARAVALLGGTTVRRIALSVALIEDCLRGPHRARLREGLARCFHAATQAHAFAARHGERGLEEVFIAAMLAGIGDLAFWGSGDPAADELDRALRAAGAARPEVERQVLGFPLTELTRRLNRLWHASPLLEAALGAGRGAGVRVRCVRYGHALAGCAEAGWPGTELARLTAEIAASLGLGETAAHGLIRDASHQAACHMAACEALDIARLIPRL